MAVDQLYSECSPRRGRPTCGRGRRRRRYRRRCCRCWTVQTLVVARLSSFFCTCFFGFGTKFSPATRHIRNVRHVYKHTLSGDGSRGRRVPGTRSVTRSLAIAFKFTQAFCTQKKNLHRLTLELDSLALVRTSKTVVLDGSIRDLAKHTFRPHTITRVCTEKYRPPSIPGPYKRTAHVIATPWSRPQTFGVVYLSRTRPITREKIADEAFRKSRTRWRITDRCFVDQVASVIRPKRSTSGSRDFRGELAHSTQIRMV